VETLVDSIQLDTVERWGVQKSQTMGDHLRRRKLMLKLLQRELAEQFGVNAATSKRDSR
jgi:hypothetical protein